MRDTVKRLVSLLLVLVMVIGLFPPAYAAESTVNETETTASLTNPPDGSVPTEETLSHTDQAVATEESTPEATEKASATTQSEPTPTESSQIAKETRTISGNEATDSATASAVTDATETPTETQYPETTQETVRSDSTQSTENTETPATEESTAPSEESTETSEAADSQVPDATEETIATEDTQASESTEHTDSTTESQVPESTESTDSTDVTEESQASDATTEPSESTQVTENAESTETTESAETATSEPPEETTSATDILPAESSEETTAPEETLPISDPTADVESSSVWEATFANITLTGDPATDLLAIATSQLGYTESVRNFVIEGEGDDAVMYGYTRYGAWYGLPYGDWCAMFVSFCLNYAGLTDIPTGAGCQSWIDTLTEAGLYYEASEFNPAHGDVIFYDLNGDGRADHVGIVSEVTEDGYVTIEGNYSDMVTYVERTDASEVMGFLRIAGIPEISGETKTVYGEWFKIEEPDPYGVATMDFDWDTVQGNWYEREYIYWDGSETLDFTYNGVSVSEDHMTIHGMTVNGTNYRAYCIDPGIRVGAGDYTGTTSAWSSLSINQQRAIGLALLYGYPTTLDSSDYMTGIAYQLATQVIIQEIRLGWRSSTKPYACTNQTFINFLMNRTGLATADGVSLSQTALKSAYDSISNNMSTHLILPKFSEGIMEQGSALAPTLKLSRQSNGTYKWTGTDSNGVLSKMKFDSVSGITFTKSGNTLTITASSSFTGTKTLHAVKEGAPDPSTADFAIFKYNSGSNYQDILITDGEYDPIDAYLNISLDSTSPMQLKKTAERGNDVAGYDLKFWNETTGDFFYLKTDSRGVGCEATVNSNGSYTITGGSTIQGFTAGTYDILEVLANKGKGVVYPSYITIDIQDSNGKSISGDSWPKTFYAPGGTELSAPAVVTQNSGTTGTITIDSSTGNARLNNVTFSESDLGAGKTVVITINNDKYHGDVTLKKTSTNGSVSNACFKIFRWTSGDTWYVKTSSSGVGYKASYDATSGTYTRSSHKGFEGATDGTYDMIEDLVAMGLAGKMFPTSWTITVYNSAGNVVNTKTYTEAAGEIIKDDNGNARLKQITISGITEGGYVSMTINNELTLRDVTVKKTSNDGNVSGIKFTVENTTTGEKDTYATGDDGTFTFQATVGHVLKFTEAVPTGYTASPKTQTITVDADESKNVVSFANTVNSQTLNIYKTSDTGVVTGVTFTIVGTNVLGNKVNKSVTITQTDSQGRGIVSTKLYPGTYTITETVPTGYTCASTNPQKVTVQYGSDQNVYFKNTVNEQTLTLYKTSDDGVVTGMSFTITGTNVKGDTVNETVTITQKDSQGRGVIATKLYPGTYTVTENPLNGYTPEASSQTVTLAVGSSNSVTFNNKVDEQTLTIYKTSTDGVVTGMSFKIEGTNVKGESISKTVKITKKDDQGRGIISTKLYPGTYVVTENVPAGYKCTSANPQTVVLEVGSPNSVTFDNKPLPQRLTIYKETDDGHVEGIGFTITGTTVEGDSYGPKTFTTTKDSATGKGIIAVDLIPGTYVVTESVPEGYLCDSANPQTVVLAVGSPNSVTFKNHLIRGNFHLTKKEVGTETVLEGAVYEVKYPDGTLVGTYTTDATGVIEIKELPYGKGYTYQETQAPDGFDVDDTVYTFDITEDKKTYYYTRENDPTVGSIEIIKTSDDGSVIEGVTLRLDYSIYDKATNSWSDWAPVAYRAADSLVAAGGCTSTGLVNGELTTDETGRVKFEGLRTNSQVVRIQYRVTEVSTVSGVSLLTDAAFIGELPYDFGDGSDPSVDVLCKIVNSSVFMFPPTGEYDLMLTTIGPVLMALAIAMSLVFFAPNVFHGIPAEKKSYLRKDTHK